MTAPTIPDWKNAKSMDQPHFGFWMSALTSEGLHAKADIARLLAMLTQKLQSIESQTVPVNADRQESDTPVKATRETEAGGIRSPDLSAPIQPVPVEPECIGEWRHAMQFPKAYDHVHIDHREVVTYIDSLQSALQLAQEERDELSDRMARVRHSADKFAEQAEKAAAELAALRLIGEVKEGGVVWLNQNPHAYPIGTKFYCIQE